MPPEAGAARCSVAERRFPIMGTRAHLIAVDGRGDGADLEDAAALVADLDRRWSRFRPDSEISRLNRAAGRPLTVAPDTYTVIAAAVEAWRLTGGRFDPTVLPALLAAGYDRSFDELGDLSEVPPAHPSAPPPVPGCAGITLVDGAGVVRLPPGVSLDLGGIAKGHAADRAALALRRAGAAGALADLGGDVRVTGTPPGGDAWVIAVDDPHRPGRDLAVLALAEGGVATSSRLRRRWVRAGRPGHHLIDPATGGCADRGVDAAVVLAATAASAEVLAKAALVAGPDEGGALIAGAGATGLLVLETGDVRALPGLEAFAA